MLDRAPTKPNRYAVYDDAHNFLRYEYHERADEPTQAGDALNKANLLPDDVAAVCGLSQIVNPQVKDALLRAFTQGRYVYELTVKCRGEPVPNLSVGGLDVLPNGKTVTDSNGLFIGISTSENPAITIDTTGYVDIRSYSGTLASTGDITTVEIELQTNAPMEIAYKSSTTVKFATAVLVDVHCVSGGGNGQAGYWSGQDCGGKGGCGGGQNYGTGISAASNTPYSILVGDVGGGSSSAFGITSNNNFDGGTGATYSATAASGTSLTVKKYGTGANVTTCSGGGGTNGNYRTPGSGGSPYGGNGGGFQCAGSAATSYGSGGGGGYYYRDDNPQSCAGGAGMQGIVYMTWRFAA